MWDECKLLCKKHISDKIKRISALFREDDFLMANFQLWKIVTASFIAVNESRCNTKPAFDRFTSTKAWKIETILMNFLRHWNVERLSVKIWRKIIQNCATYKIAIFALFKENSPNRNLLHDNIVHSRGFLIFLCTGWHTDNFPKYII